MANSKRKGAKVAKSNTVSKKLQHKKNQSAWRTCKRKPEDELTDSTEDLSDIEKPHKPSKCTKQLVDKIDVVDDGQDIEPETVSDGDGDDTISSNDEVQSRDYPII